MDAAHWHVMTRHVVGDIEIERQLSDGTFAMASEIEAAVLAVAERLRTPTRTIVRITPTYMLVASTAAPRYATPEYVAVDKAVCCNYRCLTGTTS